MPYQTIAVQKADYVLIVNIIHPVYDQIKSPSHVNELMELCIEIARDEDVWVVAITGIGEGSFQRIYQYPRIRE